MTRHEAIVMFREFVVSKLNGKHTGNNYYLVDGDRICDTCRTRKKRTLHVRIDESYPVVFKCFRASCSKDGENFNKSVSKDDFIILGFSNVKAIDTLVSKKNIIRRRISKNNIIGNLLMTENYPSIAQKEYMDKRCKLALNIPNTDKYRIIYNVSKFIKDNNIEEPKIKEMTSENSIGFICDDGVVFIRRIDGASMNKIQFKLLDNDIKGYTISDYKEIETLVIAEGIFDIINVYNFFANGIPNSIYIASMGFSNTRGIISKYYTKHISTIKRIVLFVDSDTEAEDFGIKTYDFNKNSVYQLIDYINKNCSMTNNIEIDICYNTKGKDCGDLESDVKMRRITNDKVQKEVLEYVNTFKSNKQKNRTFNRQNAYSR